MKILLANKFFYLKGGSEVAFFETAKFLEQKGHKVIFFSMQHPKNFSSRYERYFVSNVNYENNLIKNKINNMLKLLYSFEAKKKINLLIRDEQPELVHLNNIYHQISPSILHTIKKYNLPTVMSLHDYKLVCASYTMVCKQEICEACTGGKYYNCFRKTCVKNTYINSLINTIEMYLHHKIMHIYDLVDVFISPSKFLKYKIEDMGFKGNVVYLPNFVKLEEFSPQYDWHENSIVYFGRLSEEKGLPTLINAVKGLPIELKIIGDGPMKDILEHKVKHEDIDNIRFLGYRSNRELKDEIKKSMAVVVPSEVYENNPRSIIESFALGKLVVGARIGGIPELVRDNETGLNFDPGNADDLRSKIEFLQDNPDKMVEMGKNARAFVEKELNAKKHYQRLMEIYNQAAAFRYGLSHS